MQIAIAHPGQSLTLVSKRYQIRICLRKLLITVEIVVRRLWSHGTPAGGQGLTANVSWPAGLAGLAVEPVNSMMVNNFFNFCVAVFR